MALGPINYGAAQPLADFSALSAIAQQIQQRRSAAEQQRQAQAQQAQLDADIEDLGASFTPEKLATFSLKYPKLAEAAKNGWSIYTEERQRQNLQDMTGVAAALQSDRPDLALNILGQRKTALVETGEQTAETEALESIITKMQEAQKSGDGEAVAKLSAQARGILAFGIGSAMGDKANPLLERLGFGGEPTKPQVLSYGQKLVGVNEDGSPRIIYEMPDAPFTLNEGETRFGGTRGAAGGAGSASPPGGGSSAPLTVRTNNPGAIKDGPWARSMPGYTGSEGGFAKFASPAAGAAAHRKLLRENYLGKGYDTPRKIVERYAPRGENSDAAVENYVARIAKGLGIGPDDRIPTESLPQLANIMASVESGIGNSKGGDPSAEAVASVPKSKEPPKPSETRSLGGKVYVKIDGRWYQQGAGR